MEKSFMEKAWEMRLKRGGKREGAGRKPRSKPREAITLRVEPATAKKFKRMCVGNERSQSAQFTEMVKGARLP
jgi:hypothetical protein